jgi:histidyl-tRNA synthetase
MGGRLSRETMPFQALRGFRDYLPADAAARRRMQDTIRGVVRRFGYEEVETPSVESMELIKAKSGEGIVAETFCFTDKGGREVTLVPENTPSLARVYVERAKIEPLPVKWAAFPRLWRYEEPQSGRLREFGQLSLDIFGVPGIDAELEVLETTRTIMEELGLGGRYIFRTSDRRLAQGIGQALGAKDEGPFFRALDRRAKMSARDLAAELERAGIPAEKQGALAALLDRTSGGVQGATAREVLADVRQFPELPAEALAGVKNLEDLFARSEGTALSQVLALDLSLVRGLAYYTSTVFEAWARQGEIRALFGGGRYDRLIELFGGGSVPACGLAMGDITMELLLREAKLWPERPPGLDAYVAVVEPSLTDDARRIVSELRSAGVSADRDLLARPLSRQMKEAARRGAKALVLLGPREKEKGEVTLRNMRSGQQDAVAVAQVVERVRSVAAEPAPASAPSSASRAGP